MSPSSISVVLHFAFLDMRKACIAFETTIWNEQFDFLVYCRTIETERGNAHRSGSMKIFRAFSDDKTSGL